MIFLFARSKVAKIKTSIRGLKQSIESTLDEVISKKAVLDDELDSPFVPEQLQSIPIEGVLAQIDELKLKSKNCDRLMSLGEPKNAK